jgi:hypothetical protein
VGIGTQSLTTAEAAFVAKAAEGLVLVPPEPQPTTEPPRKVKQMKKAKKLLRQLMDEDTVSKSAPFDFDSAVSVLKGVADTAEAEGNTAKAQGVRREVLEMKLARQDRVGAAKKAPGVVQLFKSTASLPDDDRDLGYR